ncbi:uncharacterized protein SPSK_01893 [Sporothrix schenckii 1099-18]|uniref:Uncharacterized protein n=1 Tax=Sporothrix schenckii 1099-18 TaxID=1397361 RepID=A0A0F2MCV9_SPOSC|nr:uncharacterized protein SPSK_01893 [Sporothrix schenckii 1099-18]KJR87518.1 hypothetical protein SPSK_01893 [Sporothrix schenckii 1099-18]
MSFSPRQVESVEHWLDDQPMSTKEREKDMEHLPAALPRGSRRVGVFKEGPAMANYTRPNHPPNQHNYHDSHNETAIDDQDHDLHVRSRLQMHSRFSRRDADGDLNADYVNPVECFLRVCSACLGSAALAVGAVTYVLVRRGPTPRSSTPLDNRFGWVVAVPVAAAALLWQLTRLSLLAWHGHGRRSAALLAADLAAEAVLAVGSVICAILAGFQTARHAAYNRGAVARGSRAQNYADVGPDMALVVLLALLAGTSFGILALTVVAAHRRRRQRSGRSSRSTSSSVIEIIR